MKTIRLAAALAFILCTAPIPAARAAATAGIRWEQPVGTALNGVALGSDGSIYAVGTRPFSATTQAMLTKFSASGARMWTHAWLPSPAYSTQGVAVSVRPDGTVAWVGNVQAGCDGSAWFVETVTPAGSTIDHIDRRGSICGSVTDATGVVAKGNLVAVSLTASSCCGATYFQRGFVWGFSYRLVPRYRSPLYVTGSTQAHLLTRATGVALGPGRDLLIAGWVSTEPVSGTQPPAGLPGTAVLEKLLINGGVTWSRRVTTAPMDGLDTPVAIAVADRTVYLTAGVGGVDARWSIGGGWGPTHGWLGRFTLRGAAMSSQTWDTAAPSASEPRAIATSPAGTVWVTGMRRNVDTHGYALFLRRFAPSGARLGARTIPGGRRVFAGTGVAGGNGYAVVSGFVGPGFERTQGRLLKVAR